MMNGELDTPKSIHTYGTWWCGLAGVVAGAIGDFAALGFAATIDGGEPVPLVGPVFSYTYTVPAGLSKTLKVSFTLDGEEISGSPVFIDVAPDNTALYLGVILSLLLLLAIVVSAYQRFCSSRIKRAEEQVVSMKESLKKSLDGK